MANSAERRRYARHAIELPARIRCADGISAQGVIRDYCDGGVLLQQEPVAADAPAFSAGQVVRLQFDLLADNGSRPVNIEATIAWVRDEYLGLSLHRPSKIISEWLRRHDALARAEHAHAPSLTRAGTAQVMAKLRHLAQGEVPVILREVLVQTTDRLLEQVDRIPSGGERQQVYADLNVLEQWRSGGALLRELLDLAFQVAEPEQTADPGGALALVEKDDFERWLEASRAASALDQHFSEQLSALGSRFAAIRGSREPGTLTVPLEPKHFTTAFRNLAQRTGLGQTTRRVLFDTGSVVLASQLRGLYAALDRLLDSAGAPAARLPTAAGLPRAAAASRRRSRSGEERASEPGAATDEQAGSVSAVMLDQGSLEGLLTRERRQREEQAQDLLASLGQLPAVSPGMTRWLQRLDRPVLQQAAADPSFFQNEGHPLRAIIDGLGHLQMFQPDTDSALADDPLTQQTAALLELIERPDVDDASLREAAGNLAELAEEQSRGYQRNVERVVEASEGRDRVRRARECVTDELNRRYAGREVPEILPDLLEVGWRKALELAWLKGNGDGAFDQPLRVLDQLVRSLGARPFDSELPPAEPRRLLEQVQAELATAAFDPFRRQALETRLGRELFAANSVRRVMLTMPVLEGGSNELAEQGPPDGVNAADWQQVLARCAAIGVGDRLEFKDAESHPPALRVAWIRQDRELYVLVDQRGLRAREIGQAELAQGLYQRRISHERADGRPLSTRALDALLERMQQRLAHQAVHDSLTGLMNRRQFQAALEQAGTAAQGALLWLDIDQFRLVNDIHGYDTGDRLLMAVGRLLEQSEGSKTLGHLGADRFAVLMLGVAADAAVQWAESACAALRAMPFDWTGQRIVLSASVGVVPLPGPVDTSGALMQAAESALAAAKAAGGNSVYLYRADDPDLLRHREAVHRVVEVDDALQHGRFRLRFQSIVPVRPDTGLAPHHEVLLSLAGQASQAVPIVQFIEAAERYQRMRAVDRWVTRSVMDWIAANREHMPHLHGLAVNLSGQTVSDPSFSDFLRQQFKRTAIDPAWLSFEITETAAISDLAQAAGIINELKGMGCRVALDDFGSGLASYSYLRELPVDWLKIDGVFVRRIASGAEDYAVVKSINEIAHFLGKKTIAEYVADEAILDRVRELGVDFAQGYLISPPRPLDELLAFSPLHPAARGLAHAG
jgi:diguanylate cyclase (GGDEF)-like protein